MLNVRSDVGETSVLRKRVLPPLIALVALGFLCLVATATAESGQSAFKEGRSLEAQQKYEAAYDAYQKAYDANPKNTEYRTALTRTRFLAAAAKVHRGTLLQQAGDLAAALKLFEEASRIDPSSVIAT